MCLLGKYSLACGTGSSSSDFAMVLSLLFFHRQWLLCMSVQFKLSVPGLMLIISSQQNGDYCWLYCELNAEQYYTKSFDTLQIRCRLAVRL